MDQYELAVLYHPDLEIDLEKASSKVEKLIVDAGGKVVETDNWGKRKLAYTIAGHEHAVYVFYTVELPGQGVRTVNNALNIADEVIRFLLTKPDQKAIAKAEAMKVSRDKRLANHDNKDDSKEESKSGSKDEES